jgi:hypothetical protein
MTHYLNLGKNIPVYKMTINLRHTEVRKCRNFIETINKSYLLLLFIINCLKGEGVSRSNFTRSKLSFFTRSTVLLILAVDRNFFLAVDQKF